MKDFFTRKAVLIISPEPWNHLFVSKHHYAIELSQQNRVYFLNPPGKKYAIEKTKYENIWEVTYPHFAKGLRYLPSFVQRFSMKEKISKIQQLAGVKFDCIWSFDNSVFFDFSFLSNDVFTISHIVDYSQNFQLAKAASTARLCMGVSQNIVDLLRPHNPNTFIMPHGIAIERAKFADVQLPGVNSIKAVFAGNLDRKHFDKAVLWQLAADFPGVDFIFFGSGGQDWKRLPNTYYPGVVPSEFLLNYLRKADVLLLPYKVDEFPMELTNSHKVLEYLEAGKTIVCSYLADYADSTHLFKMVDSNDQFSQAFFEVISNLPVHNSPENMETRKHFAYQNSYRNRLREIEVLVSKTLTNQ